MLKYICLIAICIVSLRLGAQTSETHQSLVNKTITLVENNQLDSAVVTLQKAMTIDPANEMNPVLLLNLGILQRQLGKYDEALLSLSASANATDNDVLVLHNRASLLCLMDRYDEALADYNTILQKNWNDSEAHYRRGLIYLDKGNKSAAEADFMTTAQIDPNNLYAMLSRALMFKLNNEWEKAADTYSHIIAEEDDLDPVFYLNRAECYLNISQNTKAASDLQAIEQTNQKDNPFFYVLRGRLRLTQFDKSAARTDFEKAISMGYDSQLVAPYLSQTK